MIKNRKLLITKSTFVAGTIAALIVGFGFHLTSWWIPIVAYSGSWLCILTYICSQTKYVPEKTFFFNAEENKIDPKEVDERWAWKSRVNDWKANGWEMRNYKAEGVEVKIPTENGRITLNLIIVRSENPECAIALQKFLNVNDQWPSLTELAQFIAFEFAHEYGKKVDTEFGGLHNPLDTAQQEAVWTNLKTFLDEFIPKQKGEMKNTFLHAGVGSHFELPSQPHVWKMAKLK